MKKIIAAILALALLVASDIALPQAQATTRDRYCILVLDNSGDTTFLVGGTPIYTASSSLPYVKSAATKFLTNLSGTQGNHFVAVIAYNRTATVLSGFTANIESAKATIQNLNGADMGRRNIAAGLEAANGLINSISDPNAIIDIILVTPGMTDYGEYAYLGWYSDKTVGSNWVRIEDDINLYTFANVAINASNYVKSKAVVYVLGLFQSMQQVPSRGKDVAEFYRITARDLASSRDTFIVVEDPNRIEFAFVDIMEDMLEHDRKPIDVPYLWRGKLVRFGQYEQDNNWGNGKEPIEWYVLSVDEAQGTAMLLSRYLLDVQVYNYNSYQTVWESSYIRGWLNNTFYPAAFSAQEQQAIVQTRVSNSWDSVFMLNRQQIENVLGDDTCYATPYAKALGIHVNSTRRKGVSSWWVQADSTASDAPFVGSNGGVYRNPVAMNDNGVRPAITVSIQTLKNLGY